MAEASHAVFLSYASQDAEAAQRICEALRAAGIEVFLDQSELRGGDVWDQKIRREIHECALFIPVISANTASRHEGYFRLEWDLADQRSHMMARSRVFVLPVCLDATTESAADVPESFKRVQWTRLPGGETPSTFVQRVRSLMSPESSISVRPQNVPTHAAPANTDRLGASPRLKQLLLATVVVMVLAALTYLVADKFWISKHREVFAASPAASASIAEKSVAVLPFSDMSEKHDQEYFSDGLAEEVIDHLTKVHGLYVPARTSSFYFKGKQTTIAEIAKALGVAQVLEGSVRKSGSTLRITTQLIRADTGYHLWSETYDRQLDDIFKVQDEIATEVVKALALSLGAAPRNVKSANGPAYTLYLQGRSIYELAGNQAEEERGIKLVQQAITLDPSFAPAWALLSRVRVAAYENGTGASDRDEAWRAAEKAVSLDPTLSEAHLAMARVHLTNWAWKDAQREFDRAFELDRGNATVWRNAAYWSWDVGRWQEAEQRMAMATELDPLNYYNFLKLGEANYCAGNLVAAEASYRKTLALQPRADFVHGDLALVLLATGKPQAALNELNLEPEPRFHDSNLPRVLDALGRKADGDRAAADAEARYGEAHPYDIAVMYASRRDLQRAFMWWDRALGRDGGIAFLKLSVPWSGVPELAQDARFKALLRRINSPG